LKLIRKKRRKITDDDDDDDDDMIMMMITTTTMTITKIIYLCFSTIEIYTTEGIK